MARIPPHAIVAGELRNPNGATYLWVRHVLDRDLNLLLRSKEPAERRRYEDQSETTQWRAGDSPANFINSSSSSAPAEARNGKKQSARSCGPRKGKSVSNKIRSCFSRTPVRNPSAAPTFAATSKIDKSFSARPSPTPPTKFYPISPKASQIFSKAAAAPSHPHRIALLILVAKILPQAKLALAAAHETRPPTSTHTSSSNSPHVARSM